MRKADWDFLPFNQNEFTGLKVGCSAICVRAVVHMVIVYSHRDILSIVIVCCRAEGRLVHLGYLHSVAGWPFRLMPARQDRARPRSAQQAMCQCAPARLISYRSAFC